MIICLEVDGDFTEIESYLAAINIDRSLIRSIKFEQEE